MITTDSNIFVYAVDPRDPVKQTVAREVVDGMRKVGNQLALQVIGELQNVAVRKLKLQRPVAASLARDILGSFSTFAASRSAAAAALDETATGRLSYWDALMLASAAEAGCTAMLTEDLQDGATLLGLEVVNPFGPGGLSARAAALLGAP